MKSGSISLSITIGIYDILMKLLLKELSRNEKTDPSGKLKKIRLSFMFWLSFLQFWAYFSQKENVTVNGAMVFHPIPLFSPWQFGYKALLMVRNIRTLGLIPM